jgi:ribose transport system ATP-binding protein
LELRAVRKSFGRHVVLRDLDLAVHAGEVHALVGNNGSGKSTLVKVLSGFHKPDAGSEAWVSGRQLRLGDPAAADAAGIRFVHQELGLVSSLDAVDNICMGGRHPRRRAGLIDWGRARRQAVDLLATLGYRFDVRLPVAQLSSVERTGVAVARALDESITDATVLVFDEPTAALPHHEVTRLLSLIATLRARGVATVFISHHLNEVLEVADRVTVLRDGAKVGTFAASQLSEDSLIEHMVGHPPPPRVRDAGGLGSDGDVVLDVRDLRAPTLAGVSLRVHRGEIVGVAGLSGSGRDELAAAIFGAVARAGDVLLSGHNLPAMSPPCSVRRGVGYIPADRARNATMPGMSALENLCIVGLPMGPGSPAVNSGSERRDARGWLHDLRVTPPRTDFPIESFSGGNQQKVLLGRWLRAGPSLLLMDEPTQGVDVTARAEIHAHLRHAAHTSGMAILVASSDAEELAELCDRVVVIAKGTITAELRRGRLSRAAIDTEMLATTGPR